MWSFSFSPWPLRDCKHITRWLLHYQVQLSVPRLNSTTKRCTEKRIYFGLWFQRESTSQQVTGTGSWEIISSSTDKEQRKKNGSGKSLWTHRVNLQWYSSSNRALPPKDFITSHKTTLTGVQISKCLVLWWTFLLHATTLRIHRLLKQYFYIYLYRDKTSGPHTQFSLDISIDIFLYSSMSFLHIPLGIHFIIAEI